MLFSDQPVNVSITAELEDFIEQLVASGMYSSASEVVRAGLRLLRQQEELHEGRLAQLRDALAQGTTDLDAGRGEALDMAAIKQKARRSKRTTATATGAPRTPPRKKRRR